MAIKSDVQLTVGVDDALSKTAFENGIREIVDYINNRQIAKIKVSVDDSSLSTVQSQLSNINKSVTSTSGSNIGKELVSDLQEATGKAETLVSTLNGRSGRGNYQELERCLQQMNGLSNKGITAITNEFKNMSAEATHFTATWESAEGSAQHVATVIGTAKTETGAIIQDVVRWDAETGKVASVTQKIDANFQTAAEKEREALNTETQRLKTIDSTNKKLEQMNTNLAKWSQYASGTESYANYEKQVEELRKLNDEFKTSDMSMEEYNNKMAKIEEQITLSGQATEKYVKQLQEQAAEEDAAVKSAQAQQDAYNNTLLVLERMTTNIQNWSKYAGDTQAFQNYKEEATALEELNTQLKNGELSMTDYRTKVGEVTESIRNSERELVNYVGTKKNEQAADRETSATKQQELAVEKQYANLINQCQSFLVRYTAAKNSHKSASRDAYAAVESEMTSLKNLNTQYQNGEIKVEEFRNKLTSSATALKEHTTLLQQNGDATKSWGDRLQGLMTKFSSWLSASSIIMYSIQAMRKLVNASIEVEDAMAQIQIVTGATDTQMKAFFTETTELAQELGQSISDVAGAIETFARLGYSFSESSNLAEYATILANVGNTDVESATTGITSILKGYDLLASDAEHITDVLISVGQNYAISAEELFEAFERGGAALAATGATVEESAGLFAATNAALQNASATGTLWKTVSARIRGSKTELEELGEDAEECANGISKYRDEVQALTGVDIMIDDSTYKSIYDIFVELAGVWDGLSDTVQARVSEILGGTRQLSGISSTINNIADAMGAYDVAMNSAGTATAANDIYLETTTAHLNQLSATFQEFGYDLFDSSMMQFFIDLLKDIISAVDTLIDTFGTFGTISIVTFVAGLTSAMKSLNAVKDSITAVTTAVGTSNMNQLFSDTSGVYKYATALKEVDASQQNAVMSAMGLTNAQKQQVASMTQLITSHKEVKIEQIAETAGCEADTIATAANKDAKDSLTAAELLEAMQKDGSITLTYEQVSALYADEAATKSATTANLGFAASLKAMFSSNPVGMIMMIVSALVTLFSALAENTDIFKSTSEKIEELEDDLDSLRETATNAADDFQSLRSSLNLDSETSLIDEYAQLAQGVDNLGHNVSLTSDEYDRFKEIQNTLAGLFPEIDGGLDSNGDHMLKLSKDSDTATESLNALVEKEREAANLAIADTIPDMIDDINDLSKAYSKQQDELEDYKNNLTEAYNAMMDIGSGNTFVLDNYAQYIDYWDELGVDVQTTMTSAGEYVNYLAFQSATVGQNFKDSINLIEEQIDDFDTQLTSDFDQLSSAFISWVSLDAVYQEMDEAGQGMVQAFINGLDFQGLADEGINTTEEIESYIRTNIINPVNRANEEVKSAWNELLTLDIKSSDVSFSNLRDTVEKYAQIVADGIGQPVEDILSSIGLDTMDTYTQKINELTEEYEKALALGSVKNNHTQTSPYQGSSNRSQIDLSRSTNEYSEWLNSLTTTEVDAVYNLKITSDTSEWDLDEWKKQLEDFEEYADKQDILDISDDLDEIEEYFENLQAGFETYNTALSETTKGTGVQIDTVRDLQAVYEDLDDYNASEIFEKTSWGVRINTTALQELEKENENLENQKMDDALDDLVEQYNDLSEKIIHCQKGTEEYDKLLAERDDIETRIDNVALLKSEYGGLTSAFEKWQDALSGGNQRDSLEAVATSYQDMKDILEQGWTNDSSLQSYLDLWLGDVDSGKRTGDAETDFARLTETIEGTTKSLADFATLDEDGELTAAGLIDFLNAVKDAFPDENYVWVDELGNYVIDFDSGNIDAIADSFGTTTDIINLFVESLKDVSGVVISEDIVDTLGLYKSSVEECVDSLDKLSDTNKRVHDTFDSDYEFGIEYDSTNIDQLESDIEEATRLCTELNDNTDVDVQVEGADEAANLLYDLLIEYWQLSEPAIMQIDTSQCDESIGNTLQNIEDLITSLEDFQAAVELEEANVDVDTKEAENKVWDLAKELDNLDTDAYVALGLDDDSAETLKTEIHKMVEAQDEGVELETYLQDGSLEGVLEIINSIDPDAIELKADTEQATEDIHAYSEEVYGIPDTATTTLYLQNYDSNMSKLDSYISKVKEANTLTDLQGNSYVGVPTGSGSAKTSSSNTTFVKLTGTGSAAGTAKASGDWSIGYDGISLGGELGPELVVSDGKWYTVGADSAEFFHHKPGDIVFNADQTEQIFKYGGIKTGDKRGTTYAEGTAYATGASGSIKIPTVTKTSTSMAASKDEDTPQTTTTTTTTTTSPSSTPTSTSTSTSTTNNTTETERDPEVIDWIEIAIDRIERSIDNFAKIAQSSYKTLGDKLSATNSEISQVNYEMQVQQQAYNRYMQQANSVGLSSGLKQQVQNGSINIAEYDADTADLIKEYQEWFFGRNAVKSGNRFKYYLFNCWDTLKATIPQRKDEICLNVTVTKVEKNSCMRYGVNLSLI